MKTVIATADGSIQYDATANARKIKFKKDGEVTLPDAQADFLVDCGKAKHQAVKKEATKKEASKKATTNKSSTEKSEDK